MTVREIGRLIRTRKVSCKELIEQTLADLKQREKFHSFITITAEAALAQAEERDRELAAGFDRGPFHGIPTAYKDLFYTRGVRTTGGSLVFRDFVPDHDATVVRKLETAGAVSIGKTNLHELAYGITSKNPHYGYVLNPRDPRRIAGGSSGGSAALIAAGFIPMSPGTDTGGSIRVPASYCGIVGLKPTYGRVSRYGVLPLSFTLDHVGPLGSTVEDCALAMNTIAGSDPRDPSSAVFPIPDFNGTIETLAGVRVGVPKNFFFDSVDPEVEKAVRQSAEQMERLGASVSDAMIPDLASSECGGTNGAASRSGGPLFPAQRSSAVRAGCLGAPPTGQADSGPRICECPARAHVVPAQLRRALEPNRRSRCAHNARSPLPKSKKTPFGLALKQEDTRMASTRLVRAINFLGEPALSIPCGKTSTGLPIGLQLVAAPFNEPKLLSIAKVLESAANFA